VITSQRWRWSWLAARSWDFHWSEDVVWRIIWGESLIRCVDVLIWKAESSFNEPVSSGGCFHLRGNIDSLVPLIPFRRTVLTWSFSPGNNDVCVCVCVCVILLTVHVCVYLRPNRQGFKKVSRFFICHLCLDQQSRHIGTIFAGFSESTEVQNKHTIIIIIIVTVIIIEIWKIYLKKHCT